MTFSYLCPRCEYIADCRHAFGDYWDSKSRGGVGCYYQFRGYIRIDKPVFPFVKRGEKKREDAPISVGDAFARLSILKLKG